MRPSTLLLPAAFDTHRRPPPPPPTLPLPPGHHRHHRHHRVQTQHHQLPEKEATAASPPAYQWQNQRENVHKSRRLDLFNLSTVFFEVGMMDALHFPKTLPSTRFFSCDVRCQNHPCEFLLVYTYSKILSTHYYSYPHMPTMTGTGVLQVTS